MQEITIYCFGGKKADGNSNMKDILGGKGANLAGMVQLDLPVPPGFTIPCSASVDYRAANDQGEEANEAYMEQVLAAAQKGLATLKKAKHMPLLSVRSGARVSMPGMMDTILNVGLTSETLPYWEKRIGEVATLDSYRRLIQMYASVAMGLPMAAFEQALTAAKVAAGVTSDSELNAEQLGALVAQYLDIVTAAGKAFPDTLEDQVLGAIEAVFKSWDNPRAEEYRKINSIPYEWGTAVTVQSMVFGNLNNKSATGVLFSRDPSTGANVVTGEYLVNAQGEDVVAGIRTPEPIAAMDQWNPKVALELRKMVKGLEDHYKDMQDIEFTVEDGALYILQTRNGKRSAQAAFVIAHALAVEGRITKPEAFGRITPAQLFTVLKDRIDPSFKKKADITGIAAGGTVVTGVAVFNAASAINCTSPCILIREETDPDDIGGMNAAVGILTATGGLTSHAAVVARGMNKTCVVGTTGLHVGESKALIEGGKVINPGDKVTIDGTTGKVWLQIDVPVIPGEPTEVIREVLSWGFAPGTLRRMDMVDTLDAAAYLNACTGLPDSFYVDTCHMDLGGRKAIAEHMELLGNALYQTQPISNKGRIVVDLCEYGKCGAEADAFQLSMFAMQASTLADRVSAKIKGLEKWDKRLIKRLLIIKDNATCNGVYFETLRNQGAIVLGPVHTFADLLMNPTGTVSKEVLMNVFGGPEALKVAQQVAQKANPEAPVLPDVSAPRYWFESIETAKE